MLRAFVEEIGHDFERLEEEGDDSAAGSSAEKDKGMSSEDDGIFTQAVASQIAVRTARRNLTFEELEEDEKEDDEEYDTYIRER